MHLIESDHWRLWSDPAVGVQWMAGQVQRNGQWHDVVPDCRAPETKGIPAAGQSSEQPLAAANFHMIPYSNRVRDAQFAFNGQKITLEGAQKHAIHGALRKLPWKIIKAEKQSLTCEFDSREHRPVNWPWPLLARIEQQVAGATLSSRISITNLGTTDMPVGTGWHPYFVRNVGNAAPLLTLPVNAVFPDESGDCLPDGPAVDLPPELDFRKPRPLDPQQRIDCCLSGLSGSCHIHWQDAGIELIMSADEACRYLVLFNPDMPHFAVEPVSNANDAFNLAARGIDAGLTTIEPNEEFSVSMELQVRIKE